jgi:hypothetical protein
MIFTRLFLSLSVARTQQQQQLLFRLKADVLKEVQQEFLAARTILQIETSRDNDVNFIGVYVGRDDKASQFSQLRTFPPRFHLISSASAATARLLSASDELSSQKWRTQYLYDNLRAPDPRSVSRDVRARKEAQGT